MNISGYTIKKEIGRGGMAVVYLAEQVSMGRDVALKVVKPALVAADEDFGARFLAESRTIGSLIHPNIVMAHDFGESGGSYYLVTEYIPGGDLKDQIKSGLSPEEALRILREIASALAHAHSKGFVHRDIKPENILFREDGTAVLTDFGIARVLGSGTRMTKTGMSIGTPHYMSPEQARGIELDHRSDLYSLGILFYEMLTGQVPYDATETFAVGLKHINDPIPELPPQFRKYQPIIDNLLAKDPGDRYADGATLLRALADVQSGRKISRPVHATRVMKSASAASQASGFKWALGGGILALILGVVVYVVLQQANTPYPAAGGGSLGGRINNPPGAAVPQSFPASQPSGKQESAEAQPAVPGKEVAVNEPASPATAILAITSRPAGATVYLGNRRLGETPLTVSGMPSGRHDLRIEKEYYVESRIEVSLLPDQVMKRDFVLEKGKGSLTILCVPSGSEIWLDGKKLNETTPATINNLEAGSHLVRIHKDRYYNADQEVEIRHGKTHRLDLNLSGGNLVEYHGEWLEPELAEQRKVEERRLACVCPCGHKSLI